MTYSILLVGREQAVHEFLTVNLEQAGFQVVRAEDPARADRAIRNSLPDMLLLDAARGEPDSMHGLLRKLRGAGRTRDVPVILFAHSDGDEEKIAALDAGADDCLAKPVSPRELIARIRAIMRARSPQYSEEAVEIAGLRLDPVLHRVYAKGRPLAIGPTEFRMLHFLMTHPERVHTRTQLLDEIWGDHVFVEERTIDVHIRRLRRALGTEGYDAIIETVRGSGYRLRG